MPTLGSATIGGGPLREVFAFDCRAEISDGAGNTVGDWKEQVRCAAQLEYVKGVEALIAGRLETRQPIVVTIRYSLATAKIAADWRARDARTGTIYAITAILPRPRRDYIDILVSMGPAA